jgi:hypothetical protein
MKPLCLFLLAQLFFAAVVSAQQIEPSPFATMSRPETRAVYVAGSRVDEARPPISRGDMAGQVLSGGAGGLAGAFVAFLPIAMAEFGGGSGASDNATAAAVILGYYAGTVIGVQTYSRMIGLRGSWNATLVGAALGVLGGPAVLFTMPIGATIGFNRTRQLR